MHRLLATILLALAFCLCAAVGAQEANSHAIDIPAWFTESFLDFPEDVKESAAGGKRLLLYFGQDGCPYCKALMQSNFTQRPIADKTRRHFVAMALNIWGDRDTVWLDGRKRSEKELARHLKVQFTPTLLFLDEHGDVVLRLNGYQPPHRFEAALDYVAGKLEKQLSFTDYMAAKVREPAADTLHDEPFFLKPPYRLVRKAGSKPLAVVFETRYCTGCDELHRGGLVRPEVKSLLGRFDMARFAISDTAEITTPAGRRTTAAQWARDLRIAYTPSFVFFDETGAEVFRIEGYLRAFHLASSLEYVASGAYRGEPSFQRYVQARAERLRSAGNMIDLWE